jgi:ubiquinone/menaquinone biosynthesis C-methylase UbiE
MDFRSMFDDVAELYDAIRPRYPEALFDELVVAAGLRSGMHLCEIAPGTGQATQTLARRGYRITAVELGANMARIARDRLKDYPNVEIVHSSFEEVDLPVRALDLVFVATAFHWIDPSVRFEKTHALLKHAGHLAIIHRNHVSDGQHDAFTKAAQPIFKRYRRGTAAGARSYDPRRIADLKPEPVDTALFTHTHFRTFPMTARYSVDEYVNLLRTYSPTLAMTPAARRLFLEDIRQLILDDFQGEVLQHYAMSLQVAQSK